MPAGDETAISPAEQTALLALWETSCREDGVGQALALLQAAHPHAHRADLAALPIGQRDRDLLELHERLFGSSVECLADCDRCGSRMEAAFDCSEIRLPETKGEPFKVCLRRTEIEARLPDSRDLAAVEGMRDEAAAWRALVERCILAVRRGGKTVPSRQLSDALLEAVDAAAADADPQADIVLSLTCPECGAQAELPFDIARQTWAKLDHWGRAMTAAIDVIASRYGWSEAEILALGAHRRQRYLDLIAGLQR